MKSEKESQDSNDRMESPGTEISGDGKKSVRQRRDSTISFRVSKSQRERIESLADECGMSLSDYVLSRSHGYDPKPRLVEKPRVFAPFGHPGFDPAGKIILTL